MDLFRCLFPCQGPNLLLALCFLLLASRYVLLTPAWVEARPQRASARTRPIAIAPW